MRITLWSTGFVTRKISWHFSVKCQEQSKYAKSSNNTSKPFWTTPFLWDSKQLLHRCSEMILVQYMWSNGNFDNKNKEYHMAEHLSDSSLVDFKRYIWRPFFCFLQNFHKSSIQKGTGSHKINGACFGRLGQHEAGTNMLMHIIPSWINQLCMAHLQQVHSQW